MSNVRITERAYVAGIIDGEGCISIARRKVKRLNGNNWYYQTQVIVVNTDKRLADFLFSLYGGHIASPRRQRPEHKLGYRWAITGNDMRQLLEDTLTYLILKRKQARIALSFPSYYHKGRYKRTEIELNEQERNYLSMRKLNSKGSLEVKSQPKPYQSLIVGAIR